MANSTELMACPLCGFADADMITPEEIQEISEGMEGPGGRSCPVCGATYDEVREENENAS